MTRGKKFNSMTLKKQLALLAGIGLLLALVFWWEVPGFSSIKPGDPEQASSRSAA